MLSTSIKLMIESIKFFQSSIKSPHTRKNYMFLLEKYIKFVGRKDPFFQNNPRLIERCIIDFIIKMKEKENKSYSAIHNYVSPIISFYKINDIMLNTKKINKFLPEHVRVKKDRPYTHQEISKLLEISDERMRAFILLLASTGARIGAVPSLKLRNLEKIDDIYKVTIYENTREEYITFTTPEAAKAIDTYLQIRSSYGEKLDGDSYLIREYFNTRDPAKIRKARSVTKLVLEWKLIEMARRCLIRKAEHQTEGIKIASMRKDVAIANGFRKFTNTQMIKSGLNLVAKELLLGHNVGLDEHYYRPTQEELLTEYEKALDNLTINEEFRLRKKVEKLEVEKSLLDSIAQDVAMLKSKWKRRR
jgi:integrase